MTALLIATTNEGKLREIRLLLEPLGLSLRSLNDLEPIREPEETGSTFEANARLKAFAYAAEGHLLTVAEDSGLVIDALDGAPGIHSARYPGTTYPDKFANLYAALSGHPRPWTARYVCAVALVNGPNGTNGRVLFETMATVEGEIWPEPRGVNGFGYDPIFYYPPYGLTFGEVDNERKLAVAHRGRAFSAFGEWIARGGLAAALSTY
jgi:XTP/dITP diphosphohydrolase